MIEPEVKLTEAIDSMKVSRSNRQDIRNTVKNPADDNSGAMPIVHLVRGNHCDPVFKVASRHLPECVAVSEIIVPRLANIIDRQPAILYQSFNFAREEAHYLIEYFTPARARFTPHCHKSTSVGLVGPPMLNLYGRSKTPR
jgi:hypothetical protein